MGSGNGTDDELDSATLDLPPEDLAVRVRGLTKSYGGVPAVAGIDLDIARGEIFALLGPNGAGKTTTVEILEGYRRATAARSPSSARSRPAALPA